MCEGNLYVKFFPWQQLEFKPDITEEAILVIASN
jgi:hypothetical protein